jgi:hypothetical protein
VTLTKNDINSDTGVCIIDKTDADGRKIGCDTSEYLECGGGENYIIQIFDKAKQIERGLA